MSWRLLECGIWRDGGSYSATLANEDVTVSLWLQVGPWDHPRDVHYQALFVSNGDDPCLKEAVASAAGEATWLHVLRYELDVSSASADSVAQVTRLVSLLQERADGL